MPARVRSTNRPAQITVMLQTILGFTVLIVGLAGVLFNERLAKSHITFNRWALGL